MKLRELLDEVRFVGSSRLCVAIRECLDMMGNYYAGEYWIIPEGNWENGSACEFIPAIPEMIMDSEVSEVVADANLYEVYKNLGDLEGTGLDNTIILVNRPRGFNDTAYWNDNNLNRGIEYERDFNHEWAYNISLDLWREIRGMESNWRKLCLAVYSIPHLGLNNLQSCEVEAFATYLDLSAERQEIIKLAKKIALKLQDINELLALFQIMNIGSAFNPDF